MTQAFVQGLLPGRFREPIHAPMPSMKQNVTILVLALPTSERASVGDDDDSEEPLQQVSHSPIFTVESQETLDRQKKGLCSGCYQGGELRRHIDHMWSTSRFRVGSAGQFPA